MDFRPFTLPLLIAIGFCCLAASPSVVGKPASAGEDLAQTCARVGDDDTVRPYEPSLRARTERAFKVLFPDSRSMPDASAWSTQANYRCMNGKVFVCFVGANLPCAKIDANRDNPGATAFCREHPNDDGVPAFATGHDSAYAYRCRNGRAVVTGPTWTLDARGFAKEIWTALPDR